MPRLAWLALALLSSCGTQTAGPVRDPSPSPTAALALGVAVAAVPELVELRTDGDLTYYRGGQPPTELAALSVSETEVGARAGIVVQIRHTLAMTKDDLGIASCQFANAYSAVSKQRWQPPFPEPFGTDATCSLREEIAPGHLVASCVGEGLRQHGQRVTVLHLRGDDDERVVVEYALDAGGGGLAAVAKHTQARAEQALTLISDWDRRVSVASMLFADPTLTQTEAGQTAGRTALAQVNREHRRAACAHSLDLTLFNQFFEAVNRELDGAAGDPQRTGELRQLVDTVKPVVDTSQRRYAAATAATDALFARLVGKPPG